MKQLIALVLVALVALAGGFAVSRWWLDPEREPGFIDAPNPGLELAALDGRVLRPEDFSGEVLLVNFWATWCLPCREEMPMLQALQDELGSDGLQIVGVALDDAPRVQAFVEEVGVGYPILVGATDVMIANVNWGNPKGLLPYSVLLDRNGIVRWAHLGELKERELRAQIAEHL